jgi:hypothetical protein
MIKTSILYTYNMYIVKKIFISTDKKICEVYKSSIDYNFWEEQNFIIDKDSNEKIYFDTPLIDEKIIIYENNQFINDIYKYFYEDLLKKVRDEVISVYITYTKTE